MQECAIKKKDIPHIYTRLWLKTFSILEDATLWMRTRAVIYFYPIAGAGAQVRARGSDVRAHETRIKASGLDLWTVKRRAAELNGRILFLPFYIFAVFSFPISHNCLWNERRHILRVLSVCLCVWVCRWSSLVRLMWCRNIPTVVLQTPVRVLIRFKGQINFKQLQNTYYTSIYGFNVSA